MESEDVNDFVGSSTTFHVELLIVHPTIDPAVITATLGMEAIRSHRVGDPRMTPKGTVLPGNYFDTRWRFVTEYTTSNQWFLDKVDDLIDRLEPHKTFLLELLATGGTSSIIIQVFSDGYLGDKISRATLAKIVDFGLDLSFECFADPQN